MSRTMMKAVLVIFALAAANPVPAQAAVPGRLREQLKEAQDAVAIERLCEPGTGIVFVLSKGQAARLDCGQLGCGATEVLIWPTESVMHLYCVWDDGHISKRGTRRTNARISWIPAPPVVLFWLDWKSSGETVTIRLTAETDKDKLAEALKEIEQRWQEERKSLNVITAEERLSGFARLWSAVKYNFAFFDQVPELDWDAVLDAYLPRVLQDQTTQEYYRVLQECVARLRDGHTDVTPATAVTDTDMPPLLIRPVEGKAVVADLVNTEELSKASVRRGMEIIHVDGRAVADVLRENLYPYISASTPQGLDRSAYSRLLEGPQGTKVTVRLRALDGSSQEVSLTRESYSSPPPWLPARQAVLEYRELADGIVYITLNSFESEDVVTEFDAVFDRLRQAQGVIIDVRINGGGSSSNADAITARLTDKPLPSSAWKTRQYLPAFRAWGREEMWYHAPPELVPPRGDSPFLGPLVVLIGPGTVSAAEDFLIPLHASGRAILVGERTAGTTGQPLFIDLPKGGQARICTKRDTYPDGREFVGVGVIPDVEVHPTQEDISAGRDTVLEKGIKVLRAVAAAPELDE